MAEFDNDSENTSSNVSMESATAPNLFIKIKSIPRVAYARDLRLKEGDIILANNGKIFDQDINDSLNFVIKLKIANSNCYSQFVVARLSLTF